MHPQKDDEEEKRKKKEGKTLKNLGPSKLLNRLPILLAQIIGWKISYKLKNEIGQTLYPLYKHNKISKKL